MIDRKITAQPPEKMLLSDVITVELPTFKNEFGDKNKRSVPQIYSIKNVHFENSVSVQGTNNNKTRNKSGTIYVFTEYFGESIDGTWVGAKVTHNFIEYKIKKIRENRILGDVFSYEIEVI